MVEFLLPNLVNLFAFLSMTIATYAIFYFDKSVNVSLFTLALGINLIGLSHLFRIWLDVYTSPLILIMVAIGSIFLSVGVIRVFYEKSFEISRLRNREQEIKSMIKEVKRKYYRRELSEEDLKTVYSNLLKELTEIEVKIKESK